MVAIANDHMFKRKAGAAVIAVRRAGSVHAFSSINFFFLISQMIMSFFSRTDIVIDYGLDNGKNDNSMSP
jgi:hypothetical protein